MRRGGHVERMGNRRRVYRVLVGRSEVKRPLGRPKRGWEDNITMDIPEMEWGGMDWIWLRIGTDGGSIKCAEFLDQLRSC